MHFKNSYQAALHAFCLLHSARRDGGTELDGKQQTGSEFENTVTIIFM